MLWFPPTWHDDRTETDRFSILDGLRIGGSCGLVRTLLTCSLHDEASSENQRRSRRTPSPDTNEKAQNSRVQSSKSFTLAWININTNAELCCQTMLSIPQQTPNFCTLTGRGPRLDRGLAAITGLGYLFEHKPSTWWIQAISTFFNVSNQVISVFKKSLDITA